MFTSAVEIAAPVLIALMITDVAFGVVSRVVPQLNVFAVEARARSPSRYCWSAPRCRSSRWIANQMSTSASAPRSAPGTSGKLWP